MFKKELDEINKLNFSIYKSAELNLTQNNIALKNTSLEPQKKLTQYTQGFIQNNCKEDLYIDENGYQRVSNTWLESDPYMVAMGKYYFDSAVLNNVGDKGGYGAILKISYEKGHEIYVTFGDIKDPADTKESMSNDGDNYYAGSGNSANVLEFICNYNNFNTDSYSENMSLSKGTDRYNGNANTITKGQSISKIELLTGMDINWNERGKPNE